MTSIPATWHTWQNAPGSLNWMPWRPLDRPSGLDGGRPALALSGDGCLRVFAASGSWDGETPEFSVYYREQEAPGKAWNGWESPQPRPTDVRDLAVAPAADGRLVVFSVGGKEDLYSLNQVSPDGDQPEGHMISLQAP